jgi:hypothetical protein
MQPDNRGTIATLALIAVASLLAGPVAAQSSQTVTTPTKPAPTPLQVEKSEPQARSRRWSSEESRLPISADVPKAERVDPGK